MAQYTDRLTTPADFERAFDIADRLVQYELRLKWIPYLCSPSIANDTVAALRQARDIIATMHEVGVEPHDLQRWLVEWGREWKEEELKMKEATA